MSQLLKGLYTTGEPRLKAINLIEHNGSSEFPSNQGKREINN